MDKKPLARLMEKISALDEKLAEAAGWIVVIMMLTISYDVAMRYIFNSPTTWSFEINRYMLIMVVFIGGAWTLPAGGHVSVDIAVERCSEKKRQILDLITSVMASAYVLVFLVESTVFTWDAVAHNVKSTEYLAWPLWPVRAFLVIGGLLLLLEYLLRIVKNAAALFGAVPDPQPDNG
ncbi:TRAP transporter small permease subunit [Desulfospira joergensenii]|uniref:TRAP transporter small permease subunit n=1 Tax=Desulfospira joergensenii TaxID=53329 RepID=UPI0003B6343F|nr:TRAP transporter small permease subunit [Desulfospira joergensenii]